jgi:hypothetical protein
VYLTVDQTQVRTGGRVEALSLARARAGAAPNVDAWESAHSLRSGLVCLTAWWESLAALEVASNGGALDGDPDQGPGAQSLLEPATQRLLTVVNGPTAFDQTHQYLRILEVSGLKDMQAAVDNAVELGAKMSNATGTSVTLLRNLTGFARDMMLVSTYASLAEYEAAGQHLQATSSWLHRRSQYGDVLDLSTLTMNLFRRLRLS